MDSLNTMSKSKAKRLNAEYEKSERSWPRAQLECPSCGQRVPKVPRSDGQTPWNWYCKKCHEHGQHIEVNKDGSVAKRTLFDRKTGGSELTGADASFENAHSAWLEEQYAKDVAKRVVLSQQNV